jgi:hypothetical protein
MGALQVLEGLLGESNIDRYDGPTDVVAKTDGDGIHLNRKYDTNWESAYRVIWNCHGFLIA